MSRCCQSANEDPIKNTGYTRVRHNIWLHWYIIDQLCSANYSLPIRITPIYPGTITDHIISQVVASHPLRLCMPTSRSECRLFSYSGNSLGRLSCTSLLGTRNHESPKARWKKSVICVRSNAPMMDRLQRTIRKHLYRHFARFCDELQCRLKKISSTLSQIIFFIVQLISNLLVTTGSNAKCIKSII